GEVVIHFQGHGRLEPVEPDPVLVDAEESRTRPRIVPQLFTGVVVELLAPADLTGRHAGWIPVHEHAKFRVAPPIEATLGSGGLVRPVRLLRVRPELVEGGVFWSGHRES